MKGFEIMNFLLVTRSQNAPSLMFDRVLNTPLSLTSSQLSTIQSMLWSLPVTYTWQHKYEITNKITKISEKLVNLWVHVITQCLRYWNMLLLLTVTHDGKKLCISYHALPSTIWPLLYEFFHILQTNLTGL